MVAHARKQLAQATAERERLLRGFLAEAIDLEKRRSTGGPGQIASPCRVARTWMDRRCAAYAFCAATITTSASLQSTSTVWKPFVSTSSIQPRTVIPSPMRLPTRAPMISVWS